MQTFTPLRFALEFLKRDRLHQEKELKQQLYGLIVQIIKLNHPSVDRYLVLESEFALVLVAKLNFFLKLLPFEVGLLSTLDEHGEVVTDRCLDFEKQLRQTCTSEHVKAFEAFKEYLRFFNAVCNIASTNQIGFACAEGDSIDRKLMLLDQLSYNFSVEILLGHFQHDLSEYHNPPFELRVSRLRTQY